MNVQFLTALPTSKACKLPYLQNHFKRLFVLCSSEMIFSFVIEMLMSKVLEIETAFFSFPWESQGSHVGLFLLCFTYPSQLPLQTDTYLDELLKIFLKLSTKTVQVHLITGTTLEHSLQIFTENKLTSLLTCDLAQMWNKYALLNYSKKNSSRSWNSRNV